MWGENGMLKMKEQTWLQEEHFLKFGVSRFSYG
jgi:hypothetical protein